MLPRLHAEIIAELARLNLLVDGIKPLFSGLLAQPPTLVELAALGAVLHAFYTGVENILKRSRPLPGTSKSGRTGTERCSPPRLNPKVHSHLC